MNRFVRTTQEQATAAWINYLNQLRVDALLRSLAIQRGNLSDAITSINAALVKIDLEVVSTDRGGQKGMHGFIAEIAEVGIGNARELLQGRKAPYAWVNDNGPVDLVRAGVDIQQKFSMAGGRFSLTAVEEHLRKYPDYVKNGGRYQIPRDHFTTVQRLHLMSPEEAAKLTSRSGDGPSFKDWQRINKLFREGPVGIESLESSKLDYRDVQKGTYASTLESEKDSLRSMDRALRDSAYQRSRPKLEEGAKASLVAAVFEGGTSFALAVIAKRKTGKQFKEFNTQDWAEILTGSGLGAVRGGARGVSVYSLTNFTATSAAVASSIVTATLGIAEQAHRLRNDEISEFEFLESSELVCVEAAVAALSSFIGQALIPIPIVGALIGNTVGAIMYQSVSSSLSKTEVDLIKGYLADQRVLDEELAAHYGSLVEELNEGLSTYLAVLERAFSPDPQLALLGSIELAQNVGVPTEEILDSQNKTSAYFLD